MTIRTWHDIAIEAFRLTTSLVVIKGNLRIGIPPERTDSFCKEVARQVELPLSAVKQCLVGGTLGEFIYELSRADG